MSSSELFHQIMNYRQFDRVPAIAFENFEVSTLDRWRTEGLPPDQTPIEYLGMDKLINLPADFLPHPAYADRIISEDAESFITTDMMGATVRRRKENPTMYYGYIGHPVKNRYDWERYKERFDPSAPERQPYSLQAGFKSFNDSGEISIMNFWPFLFRLGFYAMGMEQFMIAFYEAPDLIHEMFSYWSSFALKTIQPALQFARVDLASFSEDLAYKNGPHLSPAIYREFFIPYQNVITQELKKHGIPYISMWTSGNAEAYIPILMDNGINCLMILEQQAGMDPVRLREKYGKGLRLIGGIAKEALIEGPKALDREIDRLMPLIEQGGYVPAIDDMIPPEVPFSYYTHYVRRIQEIRLKGL